MSSPRLPLGRLQAGTRGCVSSTRRPAIQIEILSRIADVRPDEWNTLVGYDDRFWSTCSWRRSSSGSVAGTPARSAPRAGARATAGGAARCRCTSRPTATVSSSLTGPGRAAQRNGIRYYPKLVIAIPFTPATGHRLLIAPGADGEAVTRALLAAVGEVAAKERASSVHFLFCTPEERSGSAKPVRAAPEHAVPLGEPARAVHRLRRLPVDVSVAQPQAGAQGAGRRAAHGLTFRVATGASSTTPTGRRCSSSIRPTWRAPRHRVSAPVVFRDVRETFAHRLVATLAYRGARRSPAR